MSEYTMLLSEIIDYIREEDTISYYDVEAYAYREKPEWIPVFRDRRTRIILSKCLKGKKRSENRKYDKTLYDALMNNLDAKIDYYNQCENPSDIADIAHDLERLNDAAE